MANIGTAWRSFWHSMTSYDRHASHNSPNRISKRTTAGPGRHAPLTSVSTTAVNSRPDLDTAYSHDGSDLGNSYFGSNPSTSTRAPYSPGLRTTLSRQSSDVGSPPERPSSSGEYQMQNFSEGLPPPPPVEHSWKRIDRWTEDCYEELFANVCEGCTTNDINELEHELDCSLPQDVRESLQIHDGQERGGLPTGLVFGCMLLDCEEILQEWQNWRKVNEEYLSHRVIDTPQLPVKAFAGASSSLTISPPVQNARNPAWKEDLLAKQNSQPPNAVQKSYAHPGWIPLARDWGGNNIAVDLAPGSAGTWGQVIIMGRDYDCKYVVSRSWAAFLATLADDLCSKNVHVDEETGELKLLEFKRQNVEPPYMEILRWRTDQKYGRRGMQKRTMLGTQRSISAPSSPVTGSSPYSSPLNDRGRRNSPPPFAHLQNRISPNSSHRSRVHASSPLAQVSESAPTHLRIHTQVSEIAKQGEPRTAPAGDKREKLVALESPQISSFETIVNREKENVEGSDEASGMRTVEI